VFKPKPRLEFGLKSRKYFSSSMDSSDGLSTTLIEMSKQSNQKFVIENIPAKKDLYSFAKENNIDPINLVFHGGEEYELVFTAPKKHKPTIQKIASQLKTPIIEIGHVTNGGGVYIKKGERISRLIDLGWKHFRK